MVQMCLGCIDTSKTTGPISWLPVVSKTYWTVSMDGAVVNSVITRSKNIIAVSLAGCL